MKTTKEFTVGHKTKKDKAQRTAQKWHNPENGYHAQAVKKGDGYICRVVIND